MSKLFVEHQRFYNVSETLQQHHLLVLMHGMFNHDLLIPGEKQDFPASSAKTHA